MRIVVLAKPVPDPAASEPRLGPDHRLVRSGVPTVINGNDEYALEAAVRLKEARGGEVTLLAMAPSETTDALRRGMAMGADRTVLVSDPALEGSCVVSTVRVLAAALRTLEYDLVLAGVDTSDGLGGFVGPGVAALLGLPYLGYAAAIEPDADGRTVRVRRLGARGSDLLEAGLPALIGCTQALGEPRYPALKAVMAARMKEIRSVSVADLPLDGAPVGGAAATTTVVSTRTPAARGTTRMVRGTPGEGAAAIVELLAERRLV